MGHTVRVHWQTSDPPTAPVATKREGGAIFHPALGPVHHRSWKLTQGLPRAAAVAAHIRAAHIRIAVSRETGVSGREARVAQMFSSESQ